MTARARSTRRKLTHISLKDQAKSYCGVNLWQEWAFFDLTHVETSFLPVCPTCLDLARQERQAGETKPSVD